MNAKFDFTGRRVFVAGGTSGINLGIAAAFAQAGATVAVASRKQENVDSAVADLNSRTDKASGFVMDVRKSEQVETAVGEFAQQNGGLDIVVSGAAGNFLAAAKDLSSNGFRTVVEIDLLGTFNVMKAAYPHLTRPGGCLINISAPQSVTAIPMQVHACAAKAGVDMVTRCLAIEWGPEGIRVNAVSPGPIAGTEGMQRLAPTKAIEDEIIKGVPARRFGELSDISNFCLFLASDAASYINGEVIAVDGGWTVAGVRFED